MVNPTNGVPKPDLSHVEKARSRGPNSPNKHPRPDKSSENIARDALSTSADEERPPVKVLRANPLFSTNADEGITQLPGKLQDDIKKQSKLFKSSAKLHELAKQSPLIPLLGDNENDVYITRGLDGGDVVFKPGNVAMLNKICDGIARMLGLKHAVPTTKAGKADVISRRDLQEDSKPDAPHLNDYRRLTNHLGQDVFANLDSDEHEIAEEVDVRGDVIYCLIEDEEVCLVPSKDGEGLEVKDLSSVVTSIERAADKSNKFKILGKEEDDEAVFLAPKAALGKLSNNKSFGKVALIDNYIYKVVPDKNSDHYRLERLDIKTNQDKTPDQALLTKEFSIMELADEEGELEDVIVPIDVLVELDDKPAKENKVTSFDFMGKFFTLKEIQGKTGTFEIKVKPVKKNEDLPFKDETVELIKDAEGNYFVLPKEEVSVIEKDESTSKEFVKRNGQKYDVVQDDDGAYHVIGHDIKGMIQSKIENTFTKQAGKKNNLDIRSPTQEREQFYQRIDMPSFIEAFLLTILLRPQDGKVTDLGQSNVLFQAIAEEGQNVDPQNPEVKLRPVLIDLDETMPKSNSYSLDPGFVNDGLHKVHSVRCGLMAFPQSRQKLTGAERSLLINFAMQLEENKETLLAYLQTFINSKSTFSQKQINAFNDVVVRMTMFLLRINPQQSPWTLEGLFFHIFPEYEKQWKQLKNETPEMKASRIGFEDEKDLKPRQEK